MPDEEFVTREQVLSDDGPVVGPRISGGVPAGMIVAINQLQASLTASTKNLKQSREAIDREPEYPEHPKRWGVPLAVPAALIATAMALLVLGVEISVNTGPVILALLVLAMYLNFHVPGKEDRPELKPDFSQDRFWDDVAKLELDIYGELRDPETIRRYGDELPR